MHKKNTSMKILLFSYPSSFQNIGGGEILLMKVKEYLEKAGCQVKLFDMWKDRVEDYDLLHVFGSVKDCLPLMQVAKSRNVKLAITPLFWSSWKRAFFTYGSLRDKGEFFLRHAAKLLWPQFPSKRRKMLMISDLIFPNSEIEKMHMARLFAIPKDKMVTVPNGVDRRFAESDPTLFTKKYGEEPFILSVGRLEPRKNQLNLIRAVKPLGHRLFLIGSTVTGFESYEAKCHEEGKGFTTFLPSLGHEEPLLASAYAAAKLYVLQGWFETPGLVAMEAALAGTPLAATEGGSTREYFLGGASYFDPSKPSAISAAVKEAWTQKQPSALKERILENFTWEVVAEKTLKAYEKVLS
jgi:glycosyltransferase involved in cell wall biosynthesis